MRCVHFKQEPVVSKPGFLALFLKNKFSKPNQLVGKSGKMIERSKLETMKSPPQMISQSLLFISNPDHIGEDPRF